MTGTPQKGVTGKVPLYKICCFIPQHTNGEDIALSSISEMNHFLQIHGIANSFRIDCDKNTIATCTEDLFNPGCRENVTKIDNSTEEKNNLSCDQTLENNWKNTSNVCYSNVNAIVPWHRCSKNESLVHFCKKTNPNMYPDANSILVSQNSDDPEKKGILLLKEINKETEKNDTRKKEINRLVKENTNKINSMKSSSFMGIFRKYKKNSKSYTIQISQDINDKIVNMKPPLSNENSVNRRVPILEESIVFENNIEQGSGKEIIKAEENVNSDKKKPVQDDKAEKNPLDTPKLNFQLLENNNFANTKGSSVTLNSSNDSLQTISESDLADCQHDQKTKIDETFYESPKKFIEDLSAGVMKSFIEGETDFIWMKSIQEQQIPKRSLGINKDFSAFYIIKKMDRHKLSKCLISHLTPRQKRLLATAIVNSLEEFNIVGTRWAGMAREILQDVCKIFRNQCSTMF